jgi:hypothetical protein
MSDVLESKTQTMIDILRNLPYDQKSAQGNNDPELLHINDGWAESIAKRMERMDAVVAAVRNTISAGNEEDCLLIELAIALANLDGDPHD